MSPTSPATASPAPLAVPWTRLALTHATELLEVDGPVRAIVVGPAGAGKTTVLTHLRRSLHASGREARIATARLDIAAVPAGTVLLVDDAQLRDAETLRALLDRADDPEACLVVAARPWPAPAELTVLLDRLEHAHPVIVLGHMTPADLRDDRSGASLPDDCSAAILRLTGGSTWLVAEALSLHDAHCAGGPSHEAIADGLADVIAHRIGQAGEAVRRTVESRCAGVAAKAGDDDVDIRAAYAEGLLSRNGEPPPVVRSAVLATTPPERLLEEWAALDDGSAVALAGLPGSAPARRDGRLAAALSRRADDLLRSDPALAAHVYEQAIGLGADASALSIRRALAQWGSGDIDEAARIVEFAEVSPARGSADESLAVDLVAAVWAARASMDTAHLTYRAAESGDGPPPTGAVVAAIGAARPSELAPPDGTSAHGLPSTAAVAGAVLERGLAESLTSSARDAVDDLVRASAMYTAARRSAPLPELPAVVAAVAAICHGDLDIADAVLRSACDGGQGGPGGHDRLVLWAAWVALQRERPADVDLLLGQVRAPREALSLRDRLVLDAIAVARARRYTDTATTAAAWRSARDTVMHCRFDLFTHLLLAEFVVTAARVGDEGRLTRHYEGALRGIADLGSPALWSAHLHWAGIQRGILLNRPDDLKPHARALVVASSESVPAARMAAAGRVWTAVLAGSVDASAVEEAAIGLADIGLAWDGARLAGHGAGRTDDRRAISQLLACARRLHPREDVPALDVDQRGPAPVRTSDALSAREREVAVLVLQGKTYVEIGESIFISPRTAEHHIARIRRRLGATSRSDLIAKLRLLLEDATDPELLRAPQRETA